MRRAEPPHAPRWKEPPGRRSSGRCRPVRQSEGRARLRTARTRPSTGQNCSARGVWRRGKGGAAPGYLAYDCSAVRTFSGLTSRRPFTLLGLVLALLVIVAFVLVALNAQN